MGDQHSSRRGYSVDEKLRFAADGRRLSDQELESEYGLETLRMVTLYEAIAAQPRTFDAIFYPPRVFLSYRWGDTARNKLVSLIARKLSLLGWEVIFDEQLDRLHTEVAALVSTIHTCRFFVCIWTDDYANETVTGSRGSWLFDEWQPPGISRDASGR